MYIILLNLSITVGPFAISKLDIHLVIDNCHSAILPMTCEHFCGKPEDVGGNYKQLFLWSILTTPASISAMFPDPGNCCELSEGRGLRGSEPIVGTY